jgi:hypothetical protein
MTYLRPQVEPRFGLQKDFITYHAAISACKAGEQVGGCGGWVWGVGGGCGGCVGVGVWVGVWVCGGPRKGGMMMMMSERLGDCL